MPNPSELERNVLENEAAQPEDSRVEQRTWWIPGATLKNGAVIVQSIYTGRTASVYVLAKRERDHQTPYVTWVLDDNGNAYWGHYFNDLTTAQADLASRAFGEFVLARAMELRANR